ncbi:MAG: signal recognition particle protein [Planctomycetes bacterium]|nr:signal recognition particle protein [Planctomycetota bacterium]
MFDNLTEKLQDAFSKLRSKGRLTEQDVKDGLRTIRIALLEADVSLDVVKAFVKSIREKAVGQDLINDVSAGNQIIKIVHDELEVMMGESDTSIPYREEGASVILMSGLQGSGKTTTTGKLALLLSRRDKKKPMLVAADLQRPAAIEQLKTIGKQLGFPVYAEEGSTPVEVCRNALKAAEDQDCDLILVDTAGRLHVDDELMREIKTINNVVKPDQTFLVCDAMTGQDAVHSAVAFNETLTLDGVILTKLDGDTRGGAALSLRHVTGKPVKFAGLGEQMDKLEEFHPDRMAGRILGKGDIVSLVEKAQDAMSEEEAMALHEKMMKNKFTMNDFLGQLKMIKKMGSIKDMLGMLPGLGQALKDVDVDDKHFNKIEAIILSMTPQERDDGDIIDGSRRKRIAKGCGQTVQELNQFFNQYKMMQKMMSGMGKGGGMMNSMKKMMGMGGGKNPLAGAGMPAGMDMPDLGAAGGGFMPMSSDDRKKMKKAQKEKKAKRKRSRGKK